ncbi:hypothetical protein V8C34DRAFT_103894 [Trichoderma compactum]
MENTSTPLFSSPDPLSVPLSRFACDFCREKKIRCSREQPKCATCRPWPGECVFSKEVPAPRYQTGASRYVVLGDFADLFVVVIHLEARVPGSYTQQRTTWTVSRSASVV